ncbi:thiolase family protein [Egibacter rhizosphaerae]|uniref:Thiolase family protein n=1 Tax=Egibacter rhizosphaerae TaxID=1670831 RepID=A0A411YFW5_9ACTN|nr:thiolase family protein [Egibacter rhizosphaerae]QBI19992.1 thiolase family protein [Egibacter rhizosphaerae]
MRDAVIVEALRVPTGRRKGALVSEHPADLLAQVLGQLVERTGLEPERVDDVIGGCVGQAGEQSLNVTRHGWLGAGLPESVPATTVDRQCGSSQQAAHFAAQGVLAGVYDITIACGVESMTRVPMMSNVAGANPYGEQMSARYDGGLVHQGISAEIVAQRWGVTREEADEYALRSHQLAAAAADGGHFDDEILPVKVTGADGQVREVRADEGIRRETSLEALAELEPAFYEERVAAAHPGLPWIVTAGNASQISDGAAAALIMERETAERLGFVPRWRFHTFALAGVDPVTMLSGPIPSTRRVLERSGLDIDEMEQIEVNEAFASVVLAWQRELDVDPGRVNPRGGAIALGHPLGASGARLLTTLCHGLEQGGGRYGLQTMCEGGGMANATIIERLG